MTVINANCGNCQFWAQAAMSGPVTIGEPSRGFCMAVPPTPVPRFNNGQVVGQLNARPMTRSDEMGCVAYYSPRENLADGANDGTLPAPANN